MRPRKKWTYSTQDRPFYETLISRKNGWFNTIGGTVSHPVLHDGEILTGHHGYHYPTGLWMSGNELPIDWFDDPKEATDILRYWLEPFPFVDEDDFVRALLIPATMLVSRTMIGGKMPIYLITSNGQDTGKTYLVSTLVAAITGDEIDARHFPVDEREAEKKLTSALLIDPDALLWDDLPTSLRLHSPLLCRYSTAKSLKDRILGGNTEASLPSTALQILTGIDVRAVRDTASRTVTIRQYQTDEPHPRLEGVEKWTQENRGRIIGALACLLNQPAPSGHVKSRFNTWTKVVAAPIAVATGNTRFLDEMTAVHSATGGPALDSLIAAMARHPDAIIARNQDSGDRTGFAAGEMIAQFEEELEALLAPNPGDQVPKQAGLSRRLSKFCNSASGDFWLRSNAQARSDKREKTTRFYLQRRKEEPK